MRRRGNRRRRVQRRHRRRLFARRVRRITLPPRAPRCELGDLGPLDDGPAAELRTLHELRLVRLLAFGRASEAADAFRELQRRGWQMSLVFPGRGDR